MTNMTITRMRRWMNKTIKMRTTTMNARMISNKRKINVMIRRRWECAENRHKQ